MNTSPILALCDATLALDAKEPKSAGPLIVEGLEQQRDALKAALEKLMPFVLEDYHPNCATPPYKAAVEGAINALSTLKP